MRASFSPGNITLQKSEAEEFTFTDRLNPAVSVTCRLKALSVAEQARCTEEAKLEFPRLKDFGVVMGEDGRHVTDIPEMVIGYAFWIGAHVEDNEWTPEDWIRTQLGFPDLAEQILLKIGELDNRPKATVRLVTSSSQVSEPLKEGTSTPESSRGGTDFLAVS